MLQQAIGLLQLSTTELRELLQKELAENPLLEEAPADDLPDTDADPEALGFHAGPVASEPDPDVPFDVAEVLFGPSDERAPVPQELPDEPRFESFVRTPTSLADHLGEQLRFTSVEPAVRVAADEIIGNVDEDGYLRATVEEIAGWCAIPVAAVEAALRVVQGFDPPGVAARDLRECLLIQLRDPVCHLSDAVAIAIVEDHLGALEQGRHAEIARMLSVDVERVTEAVRRIAALEPRPARSFAPVETHYVVPDVEVTRLGADFAVMLNEDDVPRLRINSHYRTVIGPGDALQRYVEDRVRSAVGLIKSIQQRQKTLYKVTHSIVQFQKAFLDKGLPHLRPLSLRDVAEDIRMHESMVRRVVTGKFVETPQGVLPLRFFFSLGPDDPQDEDDAPDREEPPDPDGEPPDPDGPAPTPPIATAAGGSGPAFERTDAFGPPFRVAAPRIVKVSAGGGPSRRRRV